MSGSENCIEGEVKGDTVAISAGIAIVERINRGDLKMLEFRKESREMGALIKDINVYMKICGMFPITRICQGGNRLLLADANKPDSHTDCDIHMLCNYFNYKGFTVLEVNMKTVRYGTSSNSDYSWDYRIEDGLVIILKKGAYPNRTYDLAGTKKHVIMHRGSYFTVLYNDKQQGNLIDSLLE